MGTHGRRPLDFGTWGALGRLREFAGSLFMGPPYMGPSSAFPTSTWRLMEAMKWVKGFGVDTRQVWGR